MTSQISSEASATIAAPTVTSVNQPLSNEQREFVERLKRLYKADHQAEYLYIQAEIDSLCIQLEQAKICQQQAL